MSDFLFGGEQAPFYSYWHSFLLLFSSGIIVGDLTKCQSIWVAPEYTEEIYTSLQPGKWFSEGKLSPIYNDINSFSMEESLARECW